MADVISRFRTATEAGDVDGFMPLIHAEAELVSPIFGRLVIRGERDLRILFTAVYGSVKGLRWVDEVSDDRLVVLRGEGRVGPTRLGDAMVLELGPDGLIHRIRPHLRPLLGIVVFALVVGAKLARHPDLILRAYRPPAARSEVSRRAQRG